MARRRGDTPSAPWLAVRGLAAIVVVIGIATALVAKATGGFEGSSDVYVGVPVSAGLITTQSPVRYHGVNVGRIADIESGAETSTVRLAVDSDLISQIPSTVVVRVVPRTFFGDIYLQLVDPAGAGGSGAAGLARGDEIRMDDSAGATALYGVFKRIVELFSQLKPEQMQSALTAISQALHGRGDAIGATIDDLSAVTADLTPALTEFLDATPQFTTVMESLHEATPDIVSALSSAAAVSRTMVEHSEPIAATTAALAGLAGALTAFMSDQRGNLVTVLDSAGRILATTGENPTGIVATLDNARAFGEAGTRVFSTGKFNITAVATFMGPMPYDMRDCPTYGPLTGAHCAESASVEGFKAAGGSVPHIGTGPPPGAALPGDAVAAGDPAQAPLPAQVPGPTPAPSGPLLPAEAPMPSAAPASAVIDPDAEARPLALLQDQVLAPADGLPSTRPSVVTSFLLGPLVRGTEVRLQ